MNIEDAHVAITGGAGGIGSALTEEFQRRAAGRVVTMDLDGTDADVIVDVSNRASVEAAFGSLERLDICVANAGIGAAGKVSDLDFLSWQRMVDVNIWGTVNTVLAALPRLREQKQGALVVMSSLSGLVGTPLLTPYAMSKHALVGLGSSLRAEVASEGIGVIVVCPGPVETPLLDEPSATSGMSVRRYLTEAAGKPITPAALASAVVDAVKRNKALVAPGRAGLAWRIQRWAPGPTGRQLAKSMNRELERSARADTG